MKQGIHASELVRAIETADLVLLCENPNLGWELGELAKNADTNVEIRANTEQVIEHLTYNSQQGDQIVIMSNGGFDNIHQRLIQALQK